MTAPAPPGPAAGNPWLSRLSLRARLLAVVAALLAVALLVAGTLIVTSLRRQLVGQVDAQLVQVAQPNELQGLIRDLSRSEGRGNDPLPSRYVVRLALDSGREVPALTDDGPGEELSQHSLPEIDGLDFAGATERGREPVTLRSEDGHWWRVSVQPLPRVTASQDGVVEDLGPGAALVALPLDGVRATLSAVTQQIVLLAVALLGTLLLVGWLAVTRAFRPLRDVQAVTSAFGAGDTSQRVLVTAPGTEVGELGNEVNSMLDRIESTLAAREASEQKMRRFIGDASHELRTPLATLRGFAELYRMGAVPSEDDVRQAFRRIETESTRMGGLVEDLLLLARLDEQRPMQRQPVDLLVLVADAVHDARALAPDRTVTLAGIDARPHPEQAITSGDESRLRQVVTNLLGNAVRHTPAGSPVALGVGRRENQAVVQVVDSGPGVPPELAEKIFERFYRTDSSRTRSGGGGSGLGLAIVEAIVAAHGGQARVLHTPGGGATFEVSLPLLDSQAAPSIDPDRTQVAEMS